MACVEKTGKGVAMKSNLWNTASIVVLLIGVAGVLWQDRGIVAVNMAVAFVIGAIAFAQHIRRVQRVDEDGADSVRSVSTGLIGDIWGFVLLTLVVGLGLWAVSRLG